MILLFILVLGMFAGWIAHLLLARNQPINWAELLVVGLAGSFVGGLLISLVSGDGLALRPSGIIGSILGAVLLLAAWQPSEDVPRAGRGNGVNCSTGRRRGGERRRLGSQYSWPANGPWAASTATGTARPGLKGSQRAWLLRHLVQLVSASSWDWPSRPDVERPVAP
jgi:uncharacterized membrane protein YeaQ/YmgE (transglycosylase-associated protein family)